MKQNLPQITFISDAISYSFKLIQDQSIQIKIQGRQLNYETSIDNSSLHLHQLSCIKLYQHIYYQYVNDGYAPQRLCSIDQSYLYLTFSFPKRAINKWACPLFSKPQENTHKDHKKLNEATAQFALSCYNQSIEASVDNGLARIQQKLKYATRILQQKLQDGIHQIQALVSHKQQQNQDDSNSIANQYSYILDQKINETTQALTSKNMKLTEEIMLMISKYERQIMTINQNCCELDTRINDLSMEHNQNIDDLQEKIQKLRVENKQQLNQLKNKLKQMTRELNNNKNPSKIINNKSLGEYNLSKDTIQVKQSDLQSRQQQMHMHTLASKIQGQEQQSLIGQEAQQQAHHAQLQSSDQSSQSEETQSNQYQQQNQQIDQFSLFHKQEMQKYQICMDSHLKEEINKQIEQFHLKNKDTIQLKERKVVFTQQYFNMKNTANLQIFIIVNALLYQPIQDNACYFLDQQFSELYRTICSYSSLYIIRIISETNLRIYIPLMVTSFIQSFKIP